MKIFHYIYLLFPLKLKKSLEILVSTLIQRCPYMHNINISQMNNESWPHYHIHWLHIIHIITSAACLCIFSFPYILPHFNYCNKHLSSSFYLEKSKNWLVHISQTQTINTICYYSQCYSLHCKLYNTPDYITSLIKLSDLPTTFHTQSSKTFL